MHDVQDVFKHNRARRNVIVAGGLILVCITLLSCVSSFMIYREGFSDTPYAVQQSLSLFAVVVVEGAFVWLVYGFTRAFSSFSERVISIVGMAFLVVVMLTNIITHFMMVKHLELSPFQQAWLAWGAVSVFIAVLIFVLLITLSDPVTKLIRLEMRYLGKQQETILNAKSNGLDSEQIELAMLERAELEARELCERIVGDSRGALPRGGSTRLYHEPQRANLRSGSRKGRFDAGDSASVIIQGVSGSTFRVVPAGSGYAIKFRPKGSKNARNVAYVSKSDFRAVSAMDFDALAVEAVRRRIATTGDDEVCALIRGDSAS